jgi:hypothetical protein
VEPTETNEDQRTGPLLGTYLRDGGVIRTGTQRAEEVDQTTTDLGGLGTLGVGEAEKAEAVEETEVVEAAEEADHQLLRELIL